MGSESVDSAPEHLEKGVCLGAFFKESDPLLDQRVYGVVPITGREQSTLVDREKGAWAPTLPCALLERH